MVQNNSWYWFILAAMYWYRFIPLRYGPVYLIPTYISAKSQNTGRYIQNTGQKI